MSSKERWAERERQWQADYEFRERERERVRKESLNMWDRIEESDASEDVKDILHRMACHIGLET